MKNLILILALSLTVFGCNKKTTIVPIAQPVYCVWINHTNGTQSFYKCVETDEEMQKLNVQLRNQNIFHTDYRKATCAECQ